MVNLEADDWIVMLQSIQFDGTGTPPPRNWYFHAFSVTLFLAEVFTFFPELPDIPVHSLAYSKSQLLVGFT
jgi:hypothetical protein